MSPIANPEPAKVISRASECMRRLMEAGLSYDALQTPITDQGMRQRLVNYWLAGAPEIKMEPASATAKQTPKAQKPLLIPVGTATVTATEESIVLSPEVLRERYNIKWYGDNFETWFFGKIIALFGDSIVAYKKLSRRSVDSPIIAELGGASVARTEPIEMLRLIEAQKHGKSGPLLTNGYANIFYWEDQIRFPEDEQIAYANEAGEKVVLRAVYVHWVAVLDGWSVFADSVADPDEWDDGSRFFSRGSRISSAA